MKYNLILAFLSMLASPSFSMDPASPPISMRKRENPREAEEECDPFKSCSVCPFCDQDAACRNKLGIFYFCGAIHCGTAIGSVILVSLTQSSWGFWAGLGCAIGSLGSTPVVCYDNIKKSMCGNGGLDFDNEENLFGSGTTEYQSESTECELSESEFGDRKSRPE